MAKRSGYKFITYLDDNPLSPTYMQTYVEKVEDTEKCPIEEDDLVLISNECELSNSGYTGYRISVYFNRTTGEYSEVKALDTECEPSSTEEQWIASGDPYCETTEKGVNTGYMVQVEVQMNPNLSNYGEKRYEKYKSPECEANNCAIWDEVSHACHISVIDCVATFDGTADITEIDINPLSDTYNTTRTVNRVHNDCENCTQTTFSWVEVGDMCGDDELLCGNGLQQTSTNSYTVSQKYKTIGNGTPIPMNEYQITLKTENDENCGYIRPIYKMEKVGGYLCDYETYTKYERYARMVSYDLGVTWSVAQPLYTERGEVIAEESYDCGRPMYRWIDNGETICVDNGDDGKVIYWDSEGVMVRIVPCDENAYVTSDMTWENVESGITSPDGYKNTYQIGDCAMELKDNAFSNTSFSDAALWLGDYTEKLGYNSLLSYSRGTLDIPSRILDFGAPFGRTTYSRAWHGDMIFNYGGGQNINTLVMHPTEPPILDEELLPAFMVISKSSAATDPSLLKNTAIFVPNESYDAYCNDSNWSAHTHSYRGRLLPMNNDDVEDYKAILRYKTDFTEWNYYVPSGETASALTVYDVWGLPSVTSITIGNGVKTISANTFNGFVGPDISFGNGVETIGDNAFSTFRGTEITIPSNVKTIGQYAFSDSNWGESTYLPLTSITLEEGVETIGANAFYKHSAETIVIPDSVKTIEGSAFAGVSNQKKLKHIVIGSGCTSIGGSAFRQTGWNRECPIQDITVKALVPPSLNGTTDYYGYVNEVFSEHFNLPSSSYEDLPYPGKNFPSGNYTIYVPCAAYEDYLESEWGYFANQGYNATNLVPYGCSGETVRLATLHQKDGTDVYIDKPVEYLAKRIREVDIKPYEDTTSAITITSNCEEVALTYIPHGIKVVNFNSNVPPLFTKLNCDYQPFVNGSANQVMNVPCNALFAYQDIFEDCPSVIEVIHPITENCIDVSWVNDFECENRYTKYYTINGETRSSEISSGYCADINLGNFVKENESTFKSDVTSGSSRMDITFNGCGAVNVYFYPNGGTFRIDWGMGTSYIGGDMMMKLNSGTQYFISYTKDSTSNYGQFIIQ